MTKRNKRNIKKKRKIRRVSKYRKRPASDHKVIRHGFPLTEIDRIEYIYEVDKKGDYLKVINVCYNHFIENKWVTIVRYDSEHGYLHRHLRISLSDESEVASRGGVIRKGNAHKWLSWAIRELKKEYANYCRGFLKRSGIKVSD